MGILLLFALNVVIQVVITNGVEQNPAYQVALNSACNDSAHDACDANVTLVEDVSTIKFSGIFVDDENRVTVQWDSKGTSVEGENAHYLLSVKGAEQESPSCLLVGESFLIRNHSNGTSTAAFPCIMADAAPGGSVYNVSVLSHNASATYLVFLPEQRANSSGRAVPVLALGWEQSCQSEPSLHVLFQPPPAPRAGLAYSEARVTCWDSREPAAYNMSHTLAKNVSESEFGVPAGRGYTVKLEFVGCTSNCPDTVEHNIGGLAACEEPVTPVSNLPPPPPPPALVTKSTPSAPQATSTAEPDGSVVQKPAPNIADSAKRTTVIAVLSAVLAAVLITVTAGCIYRRKRQRDDDDFMLHRLGSEDSDTSSLNAEKSMGERVNGGIGSGSGSAPSVLVLYSYDCAVHERVVVELAAYLRHECGCDVALDIWEQEAVRTRGAARWLDDKLDFSDFILVVGSAGARFKCQRKKQFRMKQTRPVPDMFVYAADQIAEKVRFAKRYGSRAPRCSVICFDYATPSDIPPKLDTLPTLCLMRDIHQLYCQLHSFNHASLEDGDKCVVLEEFDSTPTGRQLQEALSVAVQYFHDNPNWLGQCLEPLSPVLAAAPPSKSPHTSPRPSLTRDGRVLEQGSVEDGRRQNKRRQLKDEEVVVEPVPPPSPSSSPLCDRRHPTTLNTLVPAPMVGRGGRSSSTPPPPQHPQTLIKPVDSTTLDPDAPPPPRQDDEDEDEEEDEDAMLQRDLDFINNYHWQNEATNPTDVLLDTLSSSYESTSPAAAAFASSGFSNPLYCQHSSTKHMLAKNGLGRVSISMNGRRKVGPPPNHNNNTFVVDFNLLEEREPPRREGPPSPIDTSTCL